MIEKPRAGRNNKLAPGGAWLDLWHANEIPGSMSYPHAALQGAMDIPLVQNRDLLAKVVTMLTDRGMCPLTL